MACGTIQWMFATNLNTNLTEEDALVKHPYFRVKIECKKKRCRDVLISGVSLDIHIPLHAPLS